MLSRTSWLVALLAGLATNAAAADGAVISPGARLAANCAACHGTNGMARAGADAPSGAALPNLAGQPQRDLTASLLAYKSGARAGTIMPQIAKGYTDEQIALLAAFFAAQKPEVTR